MNNTKKIRDFLPDEVICCINEVCGLAIVRFTDCDEKELEDALSDFLKVWERETDAELEGIKPVTEDWREFICGKCEIEVVTGDYCPNCGTKIKWEADE